MLHLLKIKNHIGVFICCLLLFGMPITSSQAVTSFTINGAEEYHCQTIDGFGGGEHLLAPKTDDDFNLLFNELGISIFRCSLRHYIEDIISDDPSK